MCGIAGIVALNGQSGQHAPALRRMAMQMRHRGPDDEGYLIASKFGEVDTTCYSGEDTPPNNQPLPFFPTRPIETASNTPGQVFLAHRRLSIIDLSPRGHQPLSIDSNRYWIIHNGEIYNFAELRSELEANGIEFVGHTDTEVILQAYKQWGPACLERFNGMFAFAIWDDQEKTLFCARDRIGIKPFYYTVVDGWLLFASDIKTLVASGIYKPSPNPEGLFLGLSFGCAPRPMTMFKGVEALRQGHWMKISADGSIQTNQYWRLPSYQQKLKMTQIEATELINEQLDRAIKRRLVADVNVGTFMSGGVDSTLMTAMASQHQPGITAFTLAFKDDHKLNELDQAVGTAAMHPISHTIESVEIDSVLDDLDDMMETYGEPFYDLSPNYIICKLAAKHNVKVVMNGLGGDELFGGYKYYTWLDRWHWLQGSRMLFKISEKLPVVGHISERLQAIGQTTNGADFSNAVRMFMTDAEKHRLFQSSNFDELSTVETLRDLYLGEGTQFTDDIEAMNHMEMLNYVGNHHVYRTDAFTMRFSLEGRFPFLDHELVEAAFTIPSRFKVANGERKYVLRRLAEGKVHPSVLKMGKKGFDLPTERWMKGQLSSFVSSKLDRLAERELFDADEIKRIHSDWIRGARSYRGVWQLVSTESWLEKMDTL